ncbi:MAG: arginine--tRNA ligase [Alphaproteobacteria bacterium]|nr:arginine--tRNA ligase [Alphaproteobacteria bacterium]
MNVFKQMRSTVLAAVEAEAKAGGLPAGLDCARVTVEPPREASHGDMATNAAMILAKPASMPPRAVAEKLAKRLSAHGDVVAAEIAGPGFINLRLKDQVWRGELAAILQSGPAYGDSDLGALKPVNVEYVSANPTGPLHVGHARGTVYGDALASLLHKAGFKVTREYYVNDAGAQVDVLARSVHLRYREALGEAIAIPEGAYPGEYLKPVGAALARRDGGKWQGKPETEWLAPLRKFAVEQMMDLVREDLRAVGVRHDVFTSEQGLVEAGAVEAVLDELTKRGLIYTGVLDPPKGKKPEDWESRPQTLFRATQFGDDVDRPLKKSDGSWTYFASDIANHYDKYRRGFQEMIDVWGADHGGYVRRMQAAVKAVSAGKATLDVKICQLVRLLDKGEPVRMSKRAGTFVTLRDLVDEVGKDVVRFVMLTRKNDAPLDFDLAAVKEQSRDNPVWYVQYAHARAHSVLRNALVEFPDLELSAAALAVGPLERLTDGDELGLIRQLANWPRVVDAAAEAHEPHRLAFYLSDVAAGFHGLWTRGRDEGGIRFLVREDRALTTARLALVAAVATVIASGLAVFGVEPVKEMR